MGEGIVAAEATVSSIRRHAVAVAVAVAVAGRAKGEDIMVKIKVGVPCLVRDRIKRAWIHQKWSKKTRDDGTRTTTIAARNERTVEND